MSSMVESTLTKYYIEKYIIKKIKYSQQMAEVKYLLNFATCRLHIISSDCFSRQQLSAKNIQLTLKTYDFALLSQDFCAMKAMVS